MKEVKCPLCGSFNTRAYLPYEGDGRMGKTEYHCEECELDFFKDEEKVNKYERT